MTPSVSDTQLPVEGEWECMECGYIEEGTSNQRPKACPACNADASVFEFFESEEWDEDDWDDDDSDEEPDYSAIIGYDEDGPIFEDDWME